MIVPQRDYQFNRLCFDVQRDKALLEEMRERPETVIKRYDLRPEVAAAITRRDPGFLAAFTNPVLLRYFFFFLGVPEDVFVARLRAHKLDRDGVVVHG